MPYNDDLDYEFNIERLQNGDIKYTASAPIPEWMQRLPEDKQQKIVNDAQRRMFIRFEDMFDAAILGTPPAINVVPHDTPEMHVFDNLGEYGKDWDILDR